MTLNQLQTFTEDELCMMLYVVNILDPVVAPKMEFEPRHLTWFRHDMLINKLKNAFGKLKPEGHATYVSLMDKLGIKVEIKAEPLPSTQSFNSSSLSASTIPPSGSV